MQYFDSHAHVGIPAFGAPKLRQFRLQRALDAGVCGIMVPSVAPSDGAALPALVDACHAHIPGLSVVYALGIHPYALDQLDPQDDRAHWERLAAAIRASDDARLKAVGECGLHFVRGAHGGDRARQVAFTRQQLDLARELHRPAILHCVHAHRALLELLDERPTPSSVLHSFTGGAELAREYVRRGHFVSFSATIGLPNARKVIDAARVIPADRLLVETDSPDQTPVELRPSTNEPANLPLVVGALARARGEDVETTAKLTYDNARRVFSIEDGRD